MITIVVDTREKTPLVFADMGCRVVRGTLKSGDYSLLGMERHVAVERKSLADLFGSMTTGRARFYRELRRLSGFGMAALVVERDHAAVLRGSPRTRVNPGRMLRTLYAWCANLGVQVHFCAGRWEAGRVVFHLLAGWAEKAGGG